MAHSKGKMSSKHGKQGSLKGQKKVKVRKKVSDMSQFDKARAEHYGLGGNKNSYK